MKIQWSPPRAWDEFEDMCYQLALAERTLTGLTKYGRRGQRQHGVDIVGQRISSRTEWVGYQCKLKTEHLKGRLTSAEIEEEYEKSKEFAPGLSHLIFATTSGRDTVVLDVVNAHNASAHRRHTVEIWSWEDVCDRLDRHVEVARLFYPERFPAAEVVHGPNGEISLVLTPGRAENNAGLAAFVQHNLFRTNFGRQSGVMATAVLEAVENILNARKGQATRLLLAFDGRTLELSDNGRSFDPFDNKFVPERHQMGVRSIRYLRDLSNLRVNYASRSEEYGRGLNLLQVEIAKPIAQPTEIYCTGRAEIDFLFDRRQALEIVNGLDIHPSCDPYVLRIGSSMYGIALSAVNQLHSCLRMRMGRQRLVFHFEGPDSLHLAEECKKWTEYDPLLSVTSDRES
jgi:hypothetical protein